MRPAHEEAPCGAEGVAVDDLCLGQVHMHSRLWNMHALLDKQSVNLHAWY